MKYETDLQSPDGSSLMDPRHLAVCVLMYCNSGTEAVGLYLQLNSSTSVASDFYFRSHLSCMLDSESASGSVVSQSLATHAVGRVEPHSVSDELEQAVSVDLTLIVLWKVIIIIIIIIAG